VDSVEPNIDPSDPSVRARFTARFTEEEVEKLEGESSLETFRKVKEIYSELLPEPARSRVARSSSREEFDAIFEGIFRDGKKVRFRVGEVFRGTKTETVDVWTDFTDCGVRFQEGESYLVYAYQSDRNRLEARACSRTRRLLDAGENLAYLYFMQHGGNSTGRIYGFATSNRSDLNTPRFWDTVASPIPGLTVELRFKTNARHVHTDRNGRYVFDGLEERKYELSVFPRRYPEDTKILAGPREVHVNARGCVTELFLVPSENRLKQ